MAEGDWLCFLSRKRLVWFAVRESGSGERERRGFWRVRLVWVRVWEVGLSLIMGLMLRLWILTPLKVCVFCASYLLCFDFSMFSC